MKNCLGEKQVVQVDTNFTSDLSKDCILTTNGCVTSLGYKQAKVPSKVGQWFYGFLISFDF